MQIVYHVFSTFRKWLRRFSQAELVEVQVVSGRCACCQLSVEIVVFLLFTGSSFSCVHINGDVSECTCNFGKDGYLTYILWDQTQTALAEMGPFYKNRVFFCYLFWILKT